MGREQTSLTSVSMLGRDRDVSPERTPLLSGRRIVDPVLPGPPLPGPPPGPAAPLLPLRGVGIILKDAGETPEDFILPGSARLAALARRWVSVRNAGASKTCLSPTRQPSTTVSAPQVAQHAGEPPGSPTAPGQGRQARSSLVHCSTSRPLQRAASQVLPSAQDSFEGAPRGQMGLQKSQIEQRGPTGERCLCNSEAVCEGRGLLMSSRGSGAMAFAGPRWLLFSLLWVFSAFAGSTRLQSRCLTPWCCKMCGASGTGGGGRVCGVGAGSGVRVGGGGGGMGGGRGGGGVLQLRGGGMKDLKYYQNDKEEFMKAHAHLKDVRGRFLFLNPTP